MPCRACPFRADCRQVCTRLIRFQGKILFQPNMGKNNSLFINESLSHIQPFAMIPVSYCSYLVPPSWQLGKWKWSVNESSDIVALSPSHVDCHNWNLNYAYSQVASKDYHNTIRYRKLVQSEKSITLSEGPILISSCFCYVCVGNNWFSFCLEHTL